MVLYYFIYLVICYMLLIDYTLYFSLHVNLLVLIGVHHLIVFERRTKSLSRSRS